MVQRVVHQRDKFAVGRRAQADALLGARAMADVLKHHVAGQHQLDRPIEVTRSGGGDHAVRPGPKFAPEAGTQKARDDADVFLWNPEHLGHYIAMVHHRLRGLVEGEILSIPDRDAGVQLDRVVSLGRGHISLVYLDGSGLKGWLWIAPLAVNLGLLIGFEVLANVRLFAAIGHLDGVGRGHCLLQRVRHNGGDVLSVVADGVVLEGRAPLVEDPGKVRSRSSSKELAQVLAGIDGFDSGHRLGATAIDRRDGAAGDGGAHRDRVEHAGQIVVRRIHGGAADFERAIDAGQAGIRSGRKVEYRRHGSVSCYTVASVRAWVMQRLASGILKALSLCVWAPCRAASAA